MRDTNLAERVNDLIKSARRQKKLHGRILNHIHEIDFIDLLNFGIESSTVVVRKAHLNIWKRRDYHHNVECLDGGERLYFTARTKTEIYNIMDYFKLPLR